MRIGIVGSGTVGRTLAAALAGKGHDVRIGSRSGEGIDPIDGVAAGTFADVAAHGEAVILAVRGDAAESALALAGTEALAGKVVIDATNPLAFPEPGRPPVLSVGHDDSLGERVQRAVPGARVVKALNVITASNMVDPPDGATMFIAGDDAGAKETVTALLRTAGWESVEDLGGIEGARLLEPLALVWIVIGFRDGAWDHALAVVR